MIFMLNQFLQRNWEEDNFIMTNILDAVEFYSGTERKKMLKVPKSIGGFYVIWINLAWLFVSNKE